MSLMARKLLLQKQYPWTGTLVYNKAGTYNTVLGPGRYRFTICGAGGGGGRTAASNSRYAGGQGGCGSTGAQKTAECTLYVAREVRIIIPSGGVAGGGGAGGAAGGSDATAGGAGGGGGRPTHVIVMSTTDKLDSEFVAYLENGVLVGESLNVRGGGGGGGGGGAAASTTNSDNGGYSGGGGGGGGFFWDDFYIYAPNGSLVEHKTRGAAGVGGKGKFEANNGINGPYLGSVSTDAYSGAGGGSGSLLPGGARGTGWGAGGGSGSSWTHTGGLSVAPIAAGGGGGGAPGYLGFQNAGGGGGGKGGGPSNSNLWPGEDAWNFGATPGSVTDPYGVVHSGSDISWGRGGLADQNGADGWVAIEKIG